MRVKIADKPVRENIELFKDIMRRAHVKPVESHQIYKAWLNRNSGQFSFEEIEENGDWRQVQVSYLYDKQSGELHFYIEDVAQEEEGFAYGDLTPLAFNIMQQTLHVLNEICRRLKGPSDLDTKISVLSKLEVAAPGTQKDQNVLLAAWHPVDRFEAENLLLEKPVGTYLFRKDVYADILEKELEKQLNKKVKCLTLTYLSAFKKITDLTLVHVDGQWEIYDDDPSLKQRMYEELGDLLGGLKAELRYPLFHS